MDFNTWLNLKFDRKMATSEGTPVNEELLTSIEHNGVTFDYYLTYYPSGLVSFNVDSSQPVSMRLKANGRVFRPDDDDELSLNLPLYQDLHMQVIEHYVGDDLVWLFKQKMA